MPLEELLGDAGEAHVPGQGIEDLELVQGDVANGHHFNIKY